MAHKEIEIKEGSLEYCGKSELGHDVNTDRIKISTLRAEVERGGAARAMHWIIRHNYIIFIKERVRASEGFAVTFISISTFYKIKTIIEFIK